MADNVRIALSELLRKAALGEDVDFRREGVRVLAQALMELEGTQPLGAERSERTAERTGQRNGHRDRTGETRVGTIPVKVPRVREGSSFPSLLEPRKRAERALVAVVQEADVQGVSTRRVDDRVQALGMQGVRSRASARNWTRKSNGFATADWKEAIPLSGWTRRSSKCARTGAWFRGRWCSPLGEGQRGNATSWAWTWDQARMAPAGGSSCGDWWRVDCRACSW